MLRLPVTDPLELAVGRVSLAAQLLFLVLAAVLTPIGEELLFRGVVQSSLVTRVGLIAACVIEAALFGLMHQRGWQVIFAAFVGGMAYGALALWRGCLLPSIIAHAGSNALIAGWLVALVWINAHTPASTIAEAYQRPNWWNDPPLLAIPQEETAQEQYETALWRFGSFGLQLRKDQVKAFEAVRQRFPQNEQYGARSLLGIQEVYLRYLYDPRRAIIVGEQLLKEYPDQRETRRYAVERIAEARRELEESSVARRRFTPR